MKKYKFPVDQLNVQRGYAVISILDGLADIDPNDAAQVALAEELGGQPVRAEKKAPEPAQKEAK